MAAPKTRNWSARENVHKPKGLHLLVRGEVEVSALNKLPQARPRRDSRDPKVLGLELTIVDDPDEPSGDAMVWRCANYHEEVKADQYTSVVIRWDGAVIERIPVVDDREHGAAMKKQIAGAERGRRQDDQAEAGEEARAEESRAPKKAAPKKAAPKKAAAKKAKAAEEGQESQRRKRPRKPPRRARRKPPRNPRSRSS